MAMINGYDPSTDPLWSSVTFFLGVDGTSVIDLKTGVALTRNNVSLSPYHVVGANTRSVLFPASGDPFISIPDDPNLAFGTGDFTIEWSFYPLSIAPGGGYPAIPAVTSGGLGSSSPANLDILFYAPDNSIVLNTVDYQNGVGVAPAAISTYLNKQGVFAIVRKSGKVSFFVNGTRVGNPINYTKNMTHPISAPMYIGRRQGGGSGEIVWNFNGYYSAFRITKAARYDGTSYTIPSDFVAAPSPNNVGHVYESALITEQNAPATATKVSHRVLVQTEAPPGQFAAQVTRVVVSALLQENAGIQGVGKVHELALVQTEAPPPFDAPFINRAHMSALLEDPTESYVTHAYQNLLALVEGPIVEQRATKITHSTLALDLDRGKTGAATVSSQTVVQTELPTRDPYRTKIASVLHASRTAVYADPLTVIANRRYQAFTTMSGLQVSYPERSVSPIRVPSAVTQTAVKVNGRDLSTYRSYTQVPQFFAIAAAKTVNPNPIGIQSSTRTPQLEIKAAARTSLANPVTIIASYRFQQVNAMVGSRSSAYQDASGIYSTIRNRSLNFAAASSAFYPNPPSSMMRVSISKAEAATLASTFLNPLDPRLASTEKVSQNYTEVATHDMSLIDPLLIKSTQTAGQVKFESSSASSDYSDPIMIIPGGRRYQTALQIMHGSTDYNSLPISFTNFRHFEAAAAVGDLNMRDPALIKDTRMVAQSILLTATRTSLYDQPTEMKTKRRSSSAQVGRKPV